MFPKSGMRTAQARQADAVWLASLLEWTDVATRPDVEVKAALESWVPEYQPRPQQ